MGAGGQTEPLEGAAENGRRLVGQRTELREKRGRNGGVADVLALPVILPLPGGEHTGADGLRAFLLCAAARGERLVLDRLHGDLEVDAVEQRPDRRRRYCCTRSFAQVQRFVPYQPHGQGFMAAMS